jgi:hypothetical protein
MLYNSCTCATIPAHVQELYSIKPFLHMCRNCIALNHSFIGATMSTMKEWFLVGFSGIGYSGIGYSGIGYSGIGYFRILTAAAE